MSVQFNSIQSRRSVRGFTLRSHLVSVLGAELVTVNGRHLLLRDEDSTTVTVGKNERRLNTLSHYRVPDGSTLALVTPYSNTARSSGTYNNSESADWKISTDFVLKLSKTKWKNSNKQAR